MSKKRNSTVLSIQERLDAGIEYLKKSKAANNRYRGLLELLEELKKFKERITADEKDRFDSFVDSMTDKILQEKEAGY